MLLKNDVGTEFDSDIISVVRNEISARKSSLRNSPVKEEEKVESEEKSLETDNSESEYEKES